MACRAAYTCPRPPCVSIRSPCDASGSISTHRRPVWRFRRSSRSQSFQDTATPGEGALLGEPEGAALLTMRRTAYDDTGRAVEYGTHIYRASRYSFDFRLLVRP
ncbi:hypothetical protein GCM10010448_05760 [Streptomyces glomeratus]|uniref:UbiC transcription regulator-associated domain-containing protein n=1 Tax=Streptomyces glomeratus TaxID=284452 RepID=A0ABP6L2B4_9ACTN